MIPFDARLRQAGVLIRSGQPDQALQVLAPLRAAHPENSDVLKLCGMSLVMMGRHDEAQTLFRARYDKNPDASGVRTDLANVLLNLNRPDEALELLEESNPGTPDAATRFNLARALKGVGRVAEAVRLFETLLEQQPAHTGAMMSLGDCYKALGRADEAADMMRLAIAQNVGNGVAWWSLSNLKAGGFSDDEVNQLEELTARSRPPAQQLYFEFALGTALAQQGNHDRAFAHYARGNRMKRGLEPWDQDRYEEWLNGLQISLGQVSIPPRPTQLDSPRPVFIVSLPRSGSTLTEQILAAHPDVTAASELPWVPRIIGAESTRRGQGIAQWAEQADDEDWRRLGSEYLDRSRYWQQETPVFTDKLPGNFPYTPALLKMLPQALVVNVERDAHDVCWSCYRQLFISGSEFAYDLEDLAGYWLAHRAFMTHWARRFPERVLNISYQDLVNEPEQQVRRLLAFVGLNWDPRCLRFYEADRAVNTASASQVREKINRRGLGHWRAYEQHLQPLTDALNRD